MKTKRQDNTVGLKFKFLPATNTKPSRYKIIQTNTTKSITISAQFDVKPLQHFVNMIDKLEDVESFSLLIDNTQNDYYLFALKTSNHIIPNFINSLKY